MSGSILQHADLRPKQAGDAEPRPKRRPYTGADVTFLKAKFPTGDIAEIAVRLGRSKQSIYQMAAKLGLRRTVAKRPKPEKYVTTPEIDTQIRAFYAQPHHHQGKRCALAEKFGWPAWKITRRAIALGLVTPRTKEPSWNEDELQILEQCGHLSPLAIQRKLAAAGHHRTETGILIKRKRMGFTAPKSNDGWSGHRLAQLLGVDDHRLTAWHKKGWLKAALRESNRTPQQGGDMKWFSRAEVRRFVVDSAELVDLAKVDKIWLVELLAAGGENGRPPDPPERKHAPRPAMTLEGAQETLQSALKSASAGRIDPYMTSLQLALVHLRRAMELRTKS